MVKINFKCSKCGKESWFKVNEATYIVTVLDLICDDCYPVEEEDDAEFLALASLGKGNKFLKGDYV